MSPLPPGWTEVALGDLARFVNGAAFKESDWGESGYRIVRIQNLTDPTKPYNRTERRVKGDLYVEPGDLLVSWSATLGVFEWAGPDVAVVNQHIFRVIPSHPALHRPFLKHLLRTAIRSMQRHTHGATMKHINRGEFLGTKVPLPPLGEQRRIAAILDKAEELRAKRRAALDRLDLLSRSIFLEMFGDPVGNSRAWPCSALGEVATTASGGTPDRAEPGYFGGGIRWVKSGELHSGVVVETEETLTPEGLANSGAKLLPPGTLLVAMYGATAGVVATLGVSAATNQAVCSITPGLRIDATFLAQVLRLMSRKLLARRNGGAQPNLSQKAIRHLEIPVPPLEMQRQYAQAVERVKACVARSSESAERVDALLASLHSRAFRGEL